MGDLPCSTGKWSWNYRYLRYPGILCNKCDNVGQSHSCWPKITSSFNTPISSWFTIIHFKKPGVCVVIFCEIWHRTGDIWTPGHISRMVVSMRIWRIKKPWAPRNSFLHHHLKGWAILGAFGAGVCRHNSLGNKTLKKWETPGNITKWLATCFFV